MGRRTSYHAPILSAPPTPTVRTRKHKSRDEVVLDAFATIMDGKVGQWYRIATTKTVESARVSATNARKLARANGISVEIKTGKVLRSSKGGIYARRVAVGSKLAA